MDIKINAKGHPNQMRLKEFYMSKLSNKFNKTRFITTLKANVQSVTGDNYQVGLTAMPMKGNPLYAESTNKCENTALNEAIHKLWQQVERYKEVHYKTSHKNTIKQF